MILTAIPVTNMERHYFENIATFPVRGDLLLPANRPFKLFKPFKPFKLFKLFKLFKPFKPFVNPLNPYKILSSDFLKQNIPQEQRVAQNIASPHSFRLFY